MSIELMKKTILKVSIPLSTEPFYVQVDDTNKTVREVLKDVSDILEESGSSQAAMQMANLVSDHNCYAKGQLVAYTQQVGSLSFDSREVDNEVINYTELSLMKQHLGGL